MSHKRIIHTTSALLAGFVIAACALLCSCGKTPESSITALKPNQEITTSASDTNSTENPKTSPAPETTADTPGETVYTDPATSVPKTEPATEPTTEPSVSSGTSTVPTTVTDPETEPDQPTTSATQTTPQTTSKTTTTTTPQTTVPPTPPVTSAPETEDGPILPDHHADSELVRVKDFIPGLYVDLRYAGSNNAAGYPIYRYSDAYLRYGTVRKLAKVQSALEKEGLSLLIWDAFRPLDAQYALWTLLPDYATSPVEGKVAFNYGGTLSLAIVKSDGSAVALPSDFDEEGLKSDRDFSDVSSSAAKYGKLLDDLMQKYGFNRYLSKWYRYTDTDGYSLITTATLDETGVVSCEQWKVTCTSGTVNMRKGPSTSYEVITKLPNGTKVSVAFFHEKFAFITYGSMTGYMSAGYLTRADGQSYENQLTTVKVVEAYSYETMQKDLAELAESYPDLLSVSSIGKSEEGRDLTLAILGNPDAKNQIFVSAGIHAREHMNATLVMAQIDYMLHNLDKPFGAGGKTIREILSETCFRILPMSNPDGIHIAQTGEIPDMFKDKYDSSIAAIWKANAKGVDLNANFDADWNRYGGAGAVTEPGYMGYKGTAPECAAESKAIAEYVRSMDFDLVLSYHCTGSVIYSQYGNNKAVNAKNYDLALKLSMTSGYKLGSPGSTSTAGLKDYVVDKLGIPSLTIEFGTTECPLELREFHNIWERNRDILLTSALWVEDQ